LIIEIYKQPEAGEGTEVSYNEGRSQDNEHHRQLPKDPPRGRVSSYYILYLIYTHNHQHCIYIINWSGEQQNHYMIGIDQERLKSAINGGILACEHFHEGPCSSMILPHFLGSAATMYKMYIPIHIIPFLLFKRKRVMQK
jgi:hypothetical protein